MNMLSKELAKEGRLTIDFSNAEDVAFFTPILKSVMSNKVTKKVAKAVSNEEKIERIPKAQNSYMEFCKEARKTVDFSNIKDPKEKSRRLGQMWNELPETEKTVYKTRAQENKERYDEACRARSPCPVTKPLTPYVKFCNANRAFVKKECSNPKDVQRRLGQMWKELNEDQKKVWKEVDDQLPPLEDVHDDDKDVEVVEVVEIVEKVVEKKKDKTNEKTKKAKKASK